MRHGEDGMELNRFAKLLDKYMQLCGTSERKLAELTGFSRPYISMMREGKRCSPNYERIKCLIYNLNLTLKEEREIVDAYWQERVGKDNVIVFETIRELIESVNKIGIAGISGYQHDLPMKQTIIGEMNVLLCARMLFENQTGTVIKVIAPVQKEEFCHIMSSALCMDQTLQIEHIFSMDNDVATREVNNIAVLKNICVNVLTSMQYSPYYYYIKQQYHDSNGLFPYCILADAFVMLISDDWKEANLISDPTLVKSYHKQYDLKKVSACHCLPVCLIGNWLSIISLICFKKTERMCWNRFIRWGLVPICYGI